MLGLRRCVCARSAQYDTVADLQRDQSGCRHDFHCLGARTDHCRSSVCKSRRTFAAALLAWSSRGATATPPCKAVDRQMHQTIAGLSGMDDWNCNSHPGRRLGAQIDTSGNEKEAGLQKSPSQPVCFVVALQTALGTPLLSTRQSLLGVRMEAAALGSILPRL